MKSPLSPRIELEFFRQLWQKSDDPFWLCACAGEDFVLTAVNPAEEAISADFQPGASLRSILGHSVEADELLSGYFECRDSAQTVKFRQQLVFEGSERLFETLLVPVTNALGEVTHICGTARDLTAFLVAQRSLEELNRQLERRVAERTEALNRANGELREANRILEKLAASDSLTELANRRNFFERADAEVQQPVLPAAQAGFGPVAVGAAHVDLAQRGKLGEDLVDLVGGRVVGVDQQGNPGLILGLSHELSFTDVETGVQPLTNHTCFNSAYTSFHGKTSPARRGLSSASPKAKLSGGVQDSRRRVMVPLLRGRP